MSFTNFLIDNFVDSTYCVGYRFSHISFWEESISTFKLLKPSIHYWYADPIPCEINNRIYVFMEQYDRIKSVGRIAVSKVKHDGSLGKPVTIIKEDTHFSFPMIIPYKNEYYMIPEASETESIVIYKMVETPYEWKRYYTFKLKEKIVDIAFYKKQDGIIQLLAGKIDHSNNLFVRRKIINIHNLDDVDNIVFEVGYEDKESYLDVRNGGNIFTTEGKKYRIVQESTNKDYGMYVLRNEIEKIDLDGIVENTTDKKTVENVDVKLNRWFYRKIGTHTYGKCNNGFEVIDLAITKFSLYPLLRKIGIIRR